MSEPEAVDLDHVSDRTLIVFHETIVPAPHSAGATHGPITPHP